MIGKRMRLTTLILLICMVQALVAWQPNGVPVRQGANIEWFRSGNVMDDGGVVYVWSDTRLGDRDVWAQKVDASGTILWDDQGVLVDNKVNRQEDPVVIATTDGGCIIAWIDFTHNDAGDVYAQKLDADGNLLWQEGGVPLCLADGIQISLNIIQDLSGGAYVIWVDNRGSGGSDIYGVHLDADGNNLWDADGMAVAGGPGTQTSHTFWEDGHGNGIMAWINTDTSGEMDVRALRVMGDGTIDWDVVLCDEPGDQVQIKITPSGTDLFGFAWRDRRVDNDGDIYAQSLDIDGNLQWADEILVYADDNIQKNPRVTSDATDGSYFVTWEDERFTAGDSDLYIQKINADGSLAWDADGVLLCDEPYHQENPRLTGDGNGGVFVVWEDRRNGGFPHVDIYAQLIDSEGQIQWEEDGHAICDADLYQYAPLPRLSDGVFFTVWADARNGSTGLRFQVSGPDGNPDLDPEGQEIFWGLDGDAQNPQVIPFGTDTYLVWTDTRYSVVGFKIYFQRLNAWGDPVYAENGIPVTTIDLTQETQINQEFLDAEIFDDGGLVTVWQENAPWGFPAIHAQYVDANQQMQWGEEGILVSPEYTGAAYGCLEPEVEIWGDNDVFVAWSNQVMGDFLAMYQIAGQRYIDGVPQWGDGGMILTDIDDFGFDLYVEDLLEDYILFKSDDDVYLMRIDENGDPAEGWTEDGIVVCDANRIQGNATMKKHGDDIVIVWEDKRNFDEGNAKDLYMQVVSPDGTVQWADNGIPVASYVNDQHQAAMSIGDDAIYLAWTDFRNGMDEDVAMQKVGYDQSLQWATDGVYIAQRDSAQMKPNLSPLGDFQLVVWEDYLGAESDIFMQLVDSDGSLLWDSQGVALCDAIKSQTYPVSAPLSDGTVVTAWIDQRSSGKEPIAGLYAARVNDAGVPAGHGGVPAPRLSLEQNAPNPFNPETEISFSIPVQAEVKLEVFNIRGQRVRTLVDEQLSAGRHTIVWHGDTQNGSSAASGVYFYRLTTPQSSAVRKMVLMK